MMIYERSALLSEDDLVIKKDILFYNHKNTPIKKIFCVFRTSGLTTGVDPKIYGATGPLICGFWKHPSPSNSKMVWIASPKGFSLRSEKKFVFEFIGSFFYMEMVRNEKTKAFYYRILDPRKKIITENKLLFNPIEAKIIQKEIRSYYAEKK